jgi:hypothetical protein
MFNDGVDMSTAVYLLSEIPLENAGEGDASCVDWVI